MIDTGASVSVIDPRALTTQNSTVLGCRTVGAEWGARGLATAAPTRIQIGHEHIISNCPVVADLSWLTELVGEEISLIIGQDVLSQRFCILELDAGRLAMTKRAPVMGPRWRSLTLRRSATGRLTVDASIEGGEVVQASFDLGSSNALMMSAAFATTGGLFDGRPSSTSATNTLSGAQVGRCFTLKWMEIAGFRMDQVPAAAFEKWSGAGVPLNVGFPVFRRFDLMIDISGGLLWLAPGAQLQAPFEMDHAGLGLAFLGERLQVVHVAENSPAALGGWRINDEITAIGDQPIDRHYFKSGLSNWRSGSIGRVVTLRGDFGVRILILKQYY